MIASAAAADRARRLVLTWRSRIEQPAAEHSSVLLDGVERLEIRYWQPSTGRWPESWPFLGEGSNTFGCQKFSETATVPPGDRNGGFGKFCFRLFPAGPATAEPVGWQSANAA